MSERRRSPEELQFENETLHLEARINQTRLEILRDAVFGSVLTSRPSGDTPSPASSAKLLPRSLTESQLESILHSLIRVLDNFAKTHRLLDENSLLRQDLALATSLLTSYTSEITNLMTILKTQTQFSEKIFKPGEKNTLQTQIRDLKDSNSSLREIAAKYSQAQQRVHEVRQAGFRLGVLGHKLDFLRWERQLCRKEIDRICVALCGGSGSETTTPLPATPATPTDDVSAPVEEKEEEEVGIVESIAVLLGELRIDNRLWRRGLKALLRFIDLGEFQAVPGDITVSSAGGGGYGGSGGEDGTDVETHSSDQKNAQQFVIWIYYMLYVLSLTRHNLLVPGLCVPLPPRSGGGRQGARRRRRHKYASVFVDQIWSVPALREKVYAFRKAMDAIFETFWTGEAKLSINDPAYRPHIAVLMDAVNKLFFRRLLELQKARTPIDGGWRYSLRTVTFLLNAILLRIASGWGKTALSEEMGSSPASASVSSSSVGISPRLVESLREFQLIVGRIMEEKGLGRSVFSSQLSARLDLDPWSVDESDRVDGMVVRDRVFTMPDFLGFLGLYSFLDAAQKKRLTVNDPAWVPYIKTVESCSEIMRERRWKSVDEANPFGLLFEIQEKFVSDSQQFVAAQKKIERLNAAKRKSLLRTHSDQKKTADVQSRLDSLLKKTGAQRAELQASVQDLRDRIENRRDTHNEKLQTVDAEIAGMRGDIARLKDELEELDQLREKIRKLTHRLENPEYSPLQLSVLQSNRQSETQVVERFSDVYNIPLRSRRGRNDARLSTFAEIQTDRLKALADLKLRLTQARIDLDQMLATGCHVIDLGDTMSSHRRENDERIKLEEWHRNVLRPLRSELGEFRW